MSDIPEGEKTILEGGAKDDDEGGGEKGGPEDVLLLWENRVRILLNPAIWASVMLAFGAGSCFVAILMTIVSRSLWGLIIGVGLFAFFLVIFVGIGIVVDLFGGFRVTFALTTLGVRSVAGKGAAAASDAAVVGGILAGSLSAAGAGLLAQSEKNVFIPYGEVTKVKVNTWRRYVLVKGSFGEKPIGLYCKPENFQKVLAILKERCPAARFLGGGVPV